MKQDRTLALFHYLIAAWLLIGAVGLSYFAATAASGGPVKSCSDEAKAGTVELHPNGTSNAQAWVTYATPFCSGPIIVVTGVESHNTAGLPTAHNTLGTLTGTAVSIQLPYESDDSYDVTWVAIKASQ